MLFFQLLLVLSFGNSDYAFCLEVSEFFNILHLLQLVSFLFQAFD